MGEAVHQRNLLAEDHLDISISSQPATSSWTTVTTDMKNLVLAGDTSVDAYGVSTWFMFKASIDGLLYNLDEAETLDLSNNWWEHELNEMMSLNGSRHYMANGMINYLDDYAVSCPEIVQRELDQMLGPRNVAFSLMVCPGQAPMVGAAVAALLR